MNVPKPLEPSTILFIEGALAGGKKVGVELLQQYAAQTGRQVPAMASSNVATKSKPPAGRTRRSQKPTGGTDRSFVAAHRDALVLIIERIEGTDAAFCIATYVALRWLAFEAYQPDGPFPTTIALVAHRAGLGYNTAAKAAKILESIGVVSVQGQHIAGTKARAPSLYTFPTLRGTFPTETPPRRAERFEKREETKETLSGACWPKELPLIEAEQLASTYSLPIERINAWYSIWVTRKIEYNDPRPASSAQAVARFKTAVHADRNRPIPKGQSMGFADPERPRPRWATDDDKPHVSPWDI